MPPVQTEERSVVTFTTVVLAGKLSRETATDDSDRLRFEPEGMRAYPHSYGGLSGSGIWQLAFKANNAGVVQVADRRLIGVAYYQGDLNDAGRRFILGHGPRSIYEILLPQIDRTFFGRGDTEAPPLRGVTVSRLVSKENQRKVE
jgi:hypothetical protein